LGTFVGTKGGVDSHLNPSLFLIAENENGEELRERKRIRRRKGNSSRDFFLGLSSMEFRVFPMLVHVFADLSDIGLY